MSASVPLSRGWFSHSLEWLLLLVLLVICVPQFLSMGLWADVTLYDLCARNILAGGIHYRDVFETNLPGMDWLHVAVRSALGWSSVSIRMVDLAFFSLTAWLLARLLSGAGAARTTRFWTVLALFAYYFSTCEQCHCQRDVWMLVPALAGVALQQRQLQHLAACTLTARRLILAGFVEGLCWGAAIWIKPHVIVPLLACQLAGVVLVWRTPGHSFPRLGAALTGLLAGGLFAGALGLAWLIGTGTWPYFVNIFTEWNSDYYSGGDGLNWGNRLEKLWSMFLPWSLIHLATLPLAAVTLWRNARRPLAADPQEQGCDRARVLLSALYLGWMVQAIFLQREYWYIRLPLVVLALPVLAEWIGRLRVSVARSAVLAAAAIGLALMHPMLQPYRFALWGRCCTQTGAPELEDALALDPEWCAVRWSNLDQVRAYLQDKQLHNGDLLCLNDFTHRLYLDLGLKPAGRFLHWTTLRFLFPSHREVFDAEMRAQHPVYIVTDLRRADFDAYVEDMQQGGGSAPGLPAKMAPELARQYPWCEPIVFRSGPYCVHRVRGK